MKKLFLGAAIAMSSLTFAQQFGIKAGMNVSSLSSEEGLENQKSKIGFNAGLFMNAPIAANFSIQPELIYTQYGDKYNANVLGNNYSFTRNLDYIALPVMFQYNATPSFYLEAGPEFGLLVSAKNKLTNQDTNNVIDESRNYKDDLNSFNFGLGLGAGYYFTPNIGLTARYVAGFTDIAKDRPTGSSVKNNAFQVGLAYKF
ncbi:porin family protein [Chryseobacterium lacus]|uniref:PorT family protein n=1 Tax=Chryseobacterium lacus TaxID=2058346 RepID=A0A368MY03_9FLAO|nr:porin family protein [Chryseobacterium lacus]MBF6611212.1 PorT family protein [Chryseobacterium sp.]ODS90078.1 MAG: opacity protein [Chryseobacterium sp. SCN 40-13]RCU42733.1 PorT family protein [Chryseobacterium lacus]RST27296.1 PorT family protein [Chryseobacterium lacus]RST28155.1 PorT family protein [Chryseobacterium lacus]